jgi:hypothetical protein
MLRLIADEIGNAKDSLKKSAEKAFKTTRVAVDLMLPLYYTRDNVISLEEFCLITDSWKVIQFQQYYIDDDDTTKFDYRFNEIFFDRLFDVDPISYHFFKSSYSQISFLERLLCMLPHAGYNVIKCVSNIPSAFVGCVNTDHKNYKILSKDNRKVLTSLVHDMHRKGLKPIEYGQIGEVLFWTLERCLGTASYVKTQDLWVKMFSQILNYVVHKSVALALERLRNSEKEARESTKSVVVPYDGRRFLSCRCKSPNSKVKPYAAFDVKEFCPPVDDVHAYSEKRVSTSRRVRPVSTNRERTASTDGWVDKVLNSARKSFLSPRHSSHNNSNAKTNSGRIAWIHGNVDNGGEIPVLRKILSGNQYFSPRTFRRAEARDNSSDLQGDYNQGTDIAQNVYSIKDQDDTYERGAVRGNYWFWPSNNLPLSAKRHLVQ